MRTLFLCLMLILGLIATDLSAGDVKKVVLNDGSVIMAEVLSLSDGVYTVSSTSLGTLSIEASKVRSIQTESRQAEIQAIQKKILSDKELLDIILPLQKDPDFQKAMEDPAILEAVKSGDVNALLSNPKFMKLLNNPKILDVKDKIEK